MSQILAAFSFHSQLQVSEDSETVIHSEHDFATVAHLRINSISLQDKPLQEQLQLKIPDTLNEEHLAFYRSLIERSQIESSPSDALICLDTGQHFGVDFGFRSEGSWIYVTNVQMKSSDPRIPVLEEVKYCFNTVKGVNPPSFSRSLPMNQ